MYIVKAAKMMFVQKICMFNVDEIDPWWQGNPINIKKQKQ